MVSFSHKQHEQLVLNQISYFWTLPGYFNLQLISVWSLNCWTWQAVVTMYNFQQYRHIQAPGWTLGWTWAKKEVIWSMVGAQTTEQGDCSKYKGNIPHCCKKDPTVVDLLPGTPYNMQIANCCKGGVINSWVQDPANAVSSFQVSVGAAGTSNRTVKVPKNFTLKAPGPGYTCGVAKVVKSSRFLSGDGRRVTQALSKFIEVLYPLDKSSQVSAYLFLCFYVDNRRLHFKTDVSVNYVTGFPCFNIIFGYPPHKKKKMKKKLLLGCVSVFCAYCILFYFIFILILVFIVSFLLWVIKTSSSNQYGNILFNIWSCALVKVVMASNSLWDQGFKLHHILHGSHIYTHVVLVIKKTKKPHTISSRRV